MISERYRASTMKESDEDYDFDSIEEDSDLKEEELSLSDEDVAAAAALNSKFTEFQSFHSDLVPIKLIKMKSEIEGSEIKFGEITCFLAAFKSSGNLGCNTSNQNNNGDCSVCSTLIVQDPEFKILCLPLQDPRQRCSPPRQLGLLGFCTSVANFVDSVFLAPDLVRFPCSQFEELVPATTVSSPEKMNDYADLFTVSTPIMNASRPSIPKELSMPSPTPQCLHNSRFSFSIPTEIAAAHHR